MTKPKLETPNQLIADVRDLLKMVEPRPAPMLAEPSTYGYARVGCSECDVKMRPAAYNHHWTYYHGTSFWKEKALIKLISEATK